MSSSLSLDSFKCRKSLKVGTKTYTAKARTVSGEDAAGLGLATEVLDAPVVLSGLG